MEIFEYDYREDDSLLCDFPFPKSAVITPGACCYFCFSRYYTLEHAYLDESGRDDPSNPNRRTDWRRPRRRSYCLPLSMGYSKLCEFLIPKLDRIRMPEIKQKSVIDSICTLFWYHRRKRSGMVAVVLDVRVVTVLRDEDEAADWALRQSMRNGGFSTVPAKEEEIERLEKVTFVGGFCNEEEEGRDSCVVCFEGFDVGEMVTLMPCLHFFHPDCIARWLGTNGVCPVCRYSLPSILD